MPIAKHPFWEFCPGCREKLEKFWVELQEARRQLATLESEREANAILTEELEQLKKEKP